MKIIMFIFLINYAFSQIFQFSEKSNFYMESLQLNKQIAANVFQYQENRIFQDREYQNPLTPALYSLIIPGLGQYKNGDKYAPYVFLGLEIAAWYLHSAMNRKGDKKEIEVKQYADNPNTGFNRVLYYKRIYEKASDFETVDNYDSYFNDFSNEESNYQGIRGNQALWANLKKWESEYGDHTHNLPETKTQQYYEMIGKYNQFESGWLYTQNDSRFSFYSDYSVNNQPDFITNYYKIRNDMNSYYKTGDWAIRAVFVNHLISAIEALVVAKKLNKKMDINYQSNFNNYGIKEERVTVSYHF
jgi:hypothetical protein